MHARTTHRWVVNACQHPKSRYMGAAVPPPPSPVNDPPTIKVKWYGIWTDLIRGEPDSDDRLIVLAVPVILNAYPSLKTTLSGGIALIHRHRLGKLLCSHFPHGSFR
jgi:hypothetical protein